MHTNFLLSCKATRVSNAAVAATTDVTCTTLDMEGFESVLFEVLFGAITGSAVTSLKLQVDNDPAMGTPVDLVGPTVTVVDTADNQAFLIEVQKVPDYRYIRLIVDRGTQNAVVDGVMAYQYSGRKQPTTHDATTVGDAIVSISPRISTTGLTSTTTTYSGTTTRINQTARTSS